MPSRTSVPVSVFPSPEWVQQDLELILRDKKENSSRSLHRKNHMNLEGKDVAGGPKGQHPLCARYCAKLRHHVHFPTRQPDNRCVGWGSRHS